MPTTLKQPNYYYQASPTQTTVSIPGAPKTQAPSVDLWGQNGGLGGLFGINNLQPGSYSLAELFGMPKATPAPVVPQYSKESANQNLVNTFSNIANGGGVNNSTPSPELQPNVGQSAPLSPTGSGNQKGVVKPGGPTYQPMYNPNYKPTPIRPGGSTFRPMVLR